MTAGEFLRDLVKDLMPVHLAAVAAVAAVDVVVAVAAGSAARPWWLAFASVAGFLVLEAALGWWLLSIGRVQRWIKDGRVR